MIHEALYLKTYRFMAVGQDRWLYKALGEEKEKTFAILLPCPVHREAQEKVLEMSTCSLWLFKVRDLSPGAPSPAMTEHFSMCHQSDPCNKETGQLSVYSTQHPKEHVTQEVLSRVTVEEE